MALQLYDRGFLYVNGQLLGESSGGSVEFMGDPIIVSTLVKDFAGVYPVPKHAQITVDTFVPAKGMEFDAVTPWLNTSKVTGKFQFGGSGASMEADGFILSPTISTSSTDPSKMTFKIATEAKPIK